MTGVMVLGIGLVFFWLLAYLTRRRFGVLGLALASGALLSAMWSRELVSVIEKSSLGLASISTAALISSILVFLPAVLLLFSGPSYRGRHGRMIGSILFAVFCVVLLAEPVSGLLVLDVNSRMIFDAIADNRAYIVTIFVVLAVLDLLAVHTVGGGHNAKTKH